MNPLTAHLEKKQQPPLIEEEASSLSSLESSRRKPFSNCLLFVLLAVFVFLLACFAVYTAVAMGISVEKNQSGSVKSEALSKPPILLPTDKSILFPEGIFRPETENFIPEGMNQRMRIQIFIKGNGENDSKGDSSASQENKREETFFHPKGRFIFRKIIIHQDGLQKPEITSSEEVSQGSQEGIKEIVHMKPFMKADPFGFLFNLLPLESIIKMMENYGIPNDIPRFEQNSTHQPTISSKEEVEQPVSSLEKEKYYLPKLFTQSEKIEKSMSKEEEKYDRKPKVKTNELKEKSSEENLDPMIEDIMNVVEGMISGIQNQEKNNVHRSPITHESYRGPTNIRIIRFGSPHSREGNSDIFSPLQVHHMNHPSFKNSKTSSSSEEDSIMSQNNNYYHHSNTYQTQPTSTPPSGYYTNSPYKVSTPKSEEKKLNENIKKSTDENNNEKKTKETTEIGKTPMIDRIDTENIKPFENFFNSMYKN